MQTEQVNKRKRCANCHYPATRCVCQWVVPGNSPIEVIILQHPKEVKHAKNTVKLIRLALTNVSIFVGESTNDFLGVINRVQKQPSQYALCYPSDSSVAIESLHQEKNRNSLKGIIFIDASWRKALKMWHLNPWLHDLQAWHFSEPPESQYTIRQTTQKNGLSTLESVAYVLEQTHNLDCNHLRKLFQKMQQVSFLKR